MKHFTSLLSSSWYLLLNYQLVTLSAFVHSDPGAVSEKGCVPVSAALRVGWKSPPHLPLPRILNPLGLKNRIITPYMVLVYFVCAETGCDLQKPGRNNYLKVRKGFTVNMDVLHRATRAEKEQSIAAGILSFLLLLCAVGDSICGVVWAIHGGPDGHGLWSGFGVSCLVRVGVIGSVCVCVCVCVCVRACVCARACVLFGRTISEK